MAFEAFVGLGRNGDLVRCHLRTVHD
jgi:hypothetical protein